MEEDRARLRLCSAAGIVAPLEVLQHLSRGSRIPFSLVLARSFFCDIGSYLSCGYTTRQKALTGDITYKLTTVQKASNAGFQDPSNARYSHIIF